MNLPSYLKIAKTIRYKVLLSAAVKLIGKPFVEITSSERKVMESELNQFYNTYPMPGEEVLMEVSSDDDFYSSVDTDSVSDSDSGTSQSARGQPKRRMPMRIVNADGLAKVDINDTFQIDPTELLVGFLKKMIKHIRHVSGLKMDMITVAIPSMYGVNQRREFKECFKNACNCKKIRFLTRPLAALLALDNQRDNVSCLIDSGKAKTLKNITTNESPEIHKIVFDMTEGKYNNN